MITSAGLACAARCIPGSATLPCSLHRRGAAAAAAAADPFSTPALTPHPLLPAQIQKAGVSDLLDQIFMALVDDEARTFTYVEMAYFTRWYHELNNKKRGEVKSLVENGQLSFANGGWCMHDEAAAHYVGMVDQTALGHKFLWDEFQFAPTTGWQLDPFGHSSTQASLLSAEAGFDALFFGRIDHEDMDQRRATSQCEGVWRSSPSLGKDAEVFWGLTGSYDGNYQPPDKFDFENCVVNSDDPFADDPRLNDYNVPQRVEEFVAGVR